MSGFVSAITNSTTGITSSTLWGDVTEAVPFIVIIAGFAFGYYIMKKLLKGLVNKGKLKM